MTIWSASPFYDELDVLEIKLAELDPVVDVFVISEAPTTHSGLPKPLHFAENMDRFERWLPKIRHVVCELPTVPGNWPREHSQREQLGRGFAGLEANDLIVLSDADEIPRASLVADMDAGVYPLPINVAFPIHVYRLDWRWPGRGWCALRFFRGRDLRWNGQLGYWTGMQTMQGMGMEELVGDEYGWHFSYVGDAARIAGKIEAIADEWVKGNPDWKDPDWIQGCIETGKDVYGRETRQSERIPISELPKYVQENRDKFAHLIGSEGV